MVYNNKAFTSMQDLIAKLNNNTLTTDDKHVLTLRTEAYALFDKIFDKLNSAYPEQTGFIGECRTLTYKALDQVPIDFFTKPASSTGKYHPASDLHEGGTIRHTYAVANMLIKFLQFEHYRNEIDTTHRILMIIASILHDSVKYGWSNNETYTVFDHPILAAEFAREFFRREAPGWPNQYADFIGSVIEAHMGEWNTNKYKPNIVLPKPTTLEQKLMHEADCIAAAKDIYTLFDDTVYVLSDTKIIVMKQ